nr:uncharacterized protein LOC131780927 [Pocillopora verrucosa]
MAKEKGYFPLCTGVSIALLVVVACLLVILNRDNTEIATEHVQNPRETAPKHKKNISQTGNSTLITETKSTHIHYNRREFCQTCCHTPPCWYKNHKKCSKCANSRQSKLLIKRILQRSKTKAAKHHLRRNNKTNLKD